MTNENGSRPKVLAYYFPDWHVDPRNERWFGTGWCEWELVRSATPRFPAHRQPRVPLEGTRDEAKAENAALDISLAHKYGVDGFLVDYYWYDDGAYLDSALRDGILRAENVDQIEFALMWANHNLVDIFPASQDNRPQLLKSGAVDRASFERFAEEVIDRYFTHPSYLKVDGRPWLSIYEVGRFIEGLGGVEEAKHAIAHLDQRTKERGFPGVHLDAVVWGMAVLPEAVVVDEPAQLLAELGFRSATSYVWTHHSDLHDNQFPVGDWAKVRRDAFAEYSTFAAQLPVPFYPNATVGWDASPRTVQDERFSRESFDTAGYPWTPTFDPTPEEFEVGLREAREFLERTSPPNPVVTINAWNEWTEGSYLLPDTVHGYGYLDAVRRTFGN